MAAALSPLATVALPATAGGGGAAASGSSGQGLAAFLAMLLRLLLAGGGAGGGAPSARFGAPSSAPCGVQLAGRGGLCAAMCEPQRNLSEGDLSEGGEVGASVCDQEVLSVSERELLSMSDDELLALADGGEEAHLGPA